MDNNPIYLVMYEYYSDRQIYGYFTNRADAEKYVVSHADSNLSIHRVECYDDLANDMADIVVKYKFPVIFRHDKTSNSWVCNKNADNPEIYQAPILQPNHLETLYHNDWIRVWVHLDKYDWDLAIKIAQDILYQYMYECGGDSTDQAMEDFNKILAGRSCLSNCN